MVIEASKLNFQELNDIVRNANEDCVLSGCTGQRFIAAGLDGISLKINGVPGNALGAYLNGADIEVYGNAQDAVGDTMNAGRIIIHGNIGDAAGYAMRGGQIFIRGNAGYRAGIHMKAYKEKVPLIIIGGKAGSFLGEYQAGGDIIVLGLDCTDRDKNKPAVGGFPCTGMHGGRMFIRGNCRDIAFPAQVTVKRASEADIATIGKHITDFCGLFSFDTAEIINSEFTIITPDTKNPYKQMYVQN